MKGSNQVLLFLSFGGHLIIQLHGQNTTLITQTCNQTPNYNLCVSTLNSDPETRNAKDTRDLAIIMVLHVNDTATKTQNHIVDLLKDSTIVRQVRQLLDECSRKYSLILTSSLIETIDSLSARNYEFARDMMENVPSNVEVCEEGFKEPVKSPILADNKAMSDLSNVAYAIVLHLT